MKTCYQCGEIVNGKRNKKRIFCSKTCYQKSRKKIYLRKCKKCGEEFELKNIAYEKRGCGKYCSLQCSKYATKKYELNESFFKIIDSEEKAYWLGFLFADGYNSMDEIGVELSIKDLDHLKKLKETLNSTREIVFRERISFGKENKSAEIRFASRLMCEDLYKWGCVPKKSMIAEYPLILKEFNKHFIRGVFDGDGCFHIHKDIRFSTFSIYSSSINFAKKIKEIMEMELGTSFCFYSYKSGGYSIVANKKETVKSIYDYFYYGDFVCLYRKKEKFNMFLK